MSASARSIQWRLVSLLFVITLLNFVNRLTVAVLGPRIMADLRLTNSQFASLTTSFLIAYAASQALSGKLYDRIGIRLGFLLSVSVWSMASVAQALTSGLAGLNGFRFVLGLGEGGNWPGAAKVAAEWLPNKDRALAMGVVNSGTTIGAVIAPPLIVWMERAFGWRATFAVLGVAGLLWLVPWMVLYPTRAERAKVDVDLAAGEAGPVATRAKAKEAVRWRVLLRCPQTWAVIVSRFLGDPVWWLYVTWLPVYLAHARGFSMGDIARYAWIPFLAADAGSLAGGWMSGRLIALGWSVNRARRAVLVASTALMCAGIPVATAATTRSALLFISVVLFGFQSWIGNVQTLPSDWFPSGAVGSVAGLGGLGAGVGAILLVQATGYVVDHYSYTPILVAAGLLPILATAALFALGGEIRPLRSM